MDEKRIERLEALVELALSTAAQASSGSGYDVIVSGIVNNVPNDNAFHTIASYDLTSAQRAAYIEFQWLVEDPVAHTMAARRQGAAFQANATVGTVDNPVNLKNNIAVAPSFLFTTVGSLLVAQISIPLAGQPANARAVIKIQFLS